MIAIEFKSHNNMKQTILSLAAVLFCLAAASCGSSDKPTLTSERDTLSWAMGESLARSAQQGFYDFDIELVRQAVAYTLDNKGEQPLDEETYGNALSYINYLVVRQQRKQSMETKERSQMSEAEYFKKLEAENPNVKKTKSGFYYEVLREGKGPNAKKGLRVSFDFRAYYMLSGEKFEETYGNRPSVVHAVGNPMFPGLQEAFTMMNAGSQYRFYFPNECAFGTVGSDNIPPYTPLIYEVELHEIYKD